MTRPHRTPGAGPALRLITGNLATQEQRTAADGEPRRLLTDAELASIGMAPPKSSRFPKLHDPEPDVPFGWAHLTKREAVMLAFVLGLAVALGLAGGWGIMHLIDAVVQWQLGGLPRP